MDIKNLKPILNEIFRSNITHIVVSFILGIITYSVYDNYKTKLELERQLRQIDSLNVELKHMSIEYDALKIKATKLDSMLIDAKKSRDSVRGSFDSKFKRPKIDNSGDAYKFLNDFIKE